MYSFNNDYSEGACDQIMQALLETNKKQSAGYGLDEFCEQARGLIREKMAYTNCDIHFLVGGTQSNQTVIASALRPHEAVIAADSGHINVHETGAIEATGHKVLIAESKDGKVLANGVRKVVAQHIDEHMVKPKILYISDATELGSVYTEAELKELRQVCDAYDLYLYMDGARLPMALVAQDNDLTLAKMAQYCDVCYLGGTKCGALFGEAVVILREELKQDFRYHIKQRGGMLAKGRLLGIQFRTLFQDDLYFKLAQHAVSMAQKLQKGMEEAGISFFVKSTTNQIFPIFDTNLFNAMSERYQFQIWEKLSEHQIAVRFVTSWACEETAIDQCLQDLQKLIGKGETYD